MSGFMKPEIERNYYYSVETTDGTEIIPANVVGSKGRIADFCHGTPLDNQPCEMQYGVIARMSAPGYLDCTDWSAHGTEEEALAYLNDMYGDEL
jgi:hypothetical protein